MPINNFLVFDAQFTKYQGTWGLKFHNMFQQLL
jgi:hypothetical protein